MKSSNTGGRMLESIMLGEIPGTTFQLSFSNWLVVTAALLILTLFVKLVRRNIQSLRAYYFSRKALRLLSQHHLL